MNEQSTGVDMRTCALHDPTLALATIGKDLCSNQLDHGQAHVWPSLVPMNNNLHGHTERPGWSEMPDQVASIPSDISGTVSLIFKFSIEDKIPLAQYTVITTYI